ncbi:MAG: DsbA family oxidoreductase [Paracoccaceae bacterium]
MSDQSDQVVQVDIISDVMCPWCIIGYRQLEQALGMTKMGARVRWHPFELNPDMPAEGENLRDHIMCKYGSTEEQSTAARAQMKSLGETLGIAFKFKDDSRIVNSFKAHQLLDLALSQGIQHPLKMAFFKAHFEDGLDVSDQEVLITIATETGLDRDACQQALDSGALVDQVREKQSFWTSRGISGVPSMVFGGKFLVTGAQGAQNYADVLKRIVDEAA